MFSTLLGWFLSPLGRIAGWLSAVLFAISYVYLRGRAAGTAAQKEKLRSATKKVQDLHEAIDRSDLTLDDALRRLHARADRD